MQAELRAASYDTAVCQSHSPQEDRMRQQHRTGCRSGEDGLLTSRCQDVHITHRYHSHHHHHHHTCSQHNSEHRHTTNSTTVFYDKQRHHKQQRSKEGSQKDDKAHEGRRTLASQSLTHAEICKRATCHTPQPTSISIAQPPRGCSDP